MDIIHKYFPNLDEKKMQQFKMLQPLYKEWNSKINLISRKDIENLYERHVLHSLSIVKVINFLPSTKILDIGTGGGFPGIPLAIFFPESNFTLIDSIAKKIKVVTEISKELKLENVIALQIRAENLKEKFHFVTGRAVISLPQFKKLAQSKISKDNFNHLSNGIFYLHGEEIEIEKYFSKTFNISDFFHEEFFQTKKLTYITSI